MTSLPDPSNVTPGAGQSDTFSIPRRPDQSYYAPCPRCGLVYERDVNELRAERAQLLGRFLAALARVEAAVSALDPAVALVWRFDEAPAELRALSPHGGDEDWLTVLPPGEAMPVWASPGSPFGRCCVSEHELVDGRTVLIGAHA